MSAPNRAGYVAGLRQLADLLEQHDEFPLPYYGSSDLTPLTVFAHPSITPDTADTAAVVATFAAELSDPIETVDQDKPSPLGYQVAGWLRGLKVSLRTDAAAVCQTTTVWRSVWRTPLGAEITAEGQDVTQPAESADDASDGA